MADELSAPLLPRGQRAAARRRQLADGVRAKWPLARIALGLIALVVIGAVLRIAYVEDPDGGRPVAEAAISTTRDSNTVAGAVSAQGGPATITADPQEFPVVPGGN